MKHGIFVFLLVAVFFTSCNNDDNGGPDVITVPPRLLAEVAPENDEEIKEFLQTHFYNYEEFEANPNALDITIKIDTIEGANADKIPLIDQVTPVEIKVSSSQFGLSEEETDIPFIYYYLIARDGGGMQPTVADSTLLRYEGMLLDGTKFDAVQSFLWQELPFTIRGYGHGISKIKAASTNGLVVNPDGTFEFNDSGIGLIILPSGLAYFNGTGAAGGLPRYANLIFQVEVGRIIENTDNDNDGVPSILEDLNMNDFLFDDNTDAQGEEDAGLTIRFANFQDADDDGDGVSTRNEISDDNGNIIFPYPDANSDGTPDYLDPDTN
ncbi:FKBP-type peptidyl-prolyl cis-trans isomerase [Flagellimonas sp. 2504JD1-5]